MPGTTITIRGDSNDSKVLLSSENSTIIETDASLSTLETSMNLVSTNVSTLETSMNTLETNITTLETRVTQNLLELRPHIYMGKYETGPYSVAGTVYHKAQLIAHTYYKNKYGIDIPLYSEEHGYSQPVYEANFIKSKGNAVCAGGLSTATFGSNIRDQDYAGVITSYNHGGMKIVDALNDGLDTPLYDIQSIKNRIIQGLDYEDGFRAFIIDIAGVDGTIDTDMTSKHVYFIRWGHPSGASDYEDAITFENFASSVIYHDETTGVAGGPIVGNLATGPIIHVVTAIYPAAGYAFPAYGVTDEMARLDEEMTIINANIAGGQDAHFFVYTWGDSWNYMIDLLDTNGHLDKTYAIWWCSYYKEGLKIVTSAEMDKTSEFYTDITDVTSELYDPRFTSLQNNHLATMGMVDFMASAELYLSAKKADGSLPQSDAVAKLSDDITFRPEFGTIASPLTGLPKKHSGVKIITVTPDMVSAGFSIETRAFTATSVASAANFTYPIAATFNAAISDLLENDTTLETQIAGLLANDTTLETSMNLVETSVDSLESNALKLYKEQKTKEIFHLGQKIAENISSYDDDNYSITYLRGLLPNNDKKVTLKQSNLRSNFKTPLNTLPIFASSNLVIAEIINQHIVDEPEDIEVDAEQSELILMAANTITVETGEERNSTYKYWPQVYYNNVDTAGYEVFEAEEITGLNKQYALWEIWPIAYTTNSDNFYTKTFGLTPEKNSKMELDYNNGKFLFNSMVGGNIPDDFLTFLSYGSNTLFYRMPDGNTIYLFGNYWKNLNHQRTIQQPYLDIVKNHGFEIAVRLQLKTYDNETVIWTGQDLSPYGKPNILFGSPDTDFETPSFLEVEEGDGTPSEDTFIYKGKNYKLKPVSWLYETLYTDGVLDSFKVEEHIAEYIMQDKNGRPDQCMATVFRTAKRYGHDFGSEQTNDKITVTRQISKDHHLEGFDAMSETDRKTAIDNFTLGNLTRVPQNLSWTTGPLKGFNVLALVKVVASVVPAMMMAALGATVTYVVDPTEINFPSFEVPLTATGKRVYLNLRHDNIDDRAIFEELLGKTHIFITNIKKPSMERLGYDSDTISTQGYFGSKGGIYCEFTALGPGDSNEIYKGFADTTAQLNGLANQFFRSDNPTYEYAWSFYQDNVGAISLMVAAMDTLAKWKRRGGVWETRTSLSQSGNFFAKNLKEIGSPYDWNEKSDISSDLSALIEYHSKSVSDAGIANINSNFADFSDIFKANEHFNNNHDKFDTKDWVVSTQKVLPYRRKDTDNQLVFIGDIEIENQLIGNYITPEKAVHRFNANN